MLDKHEASASKRSESDLPPGWAKAELGKVSHVVRGITFPASAKESERFEGSIVCLRTANIQEKVDWDDLIHVPMKYVKKEEKLLRKNDILISMANSFELVGKVSFVENVQARSTFGAFIAAIRTDEAVIPKYLFYHLRSAETLGVMRRASSQTVNIANLSLTRLNPTPIRVAPRQEQERIVAEIEKQFTRLDAAVANLKRVQANLERYKASVLKAACEGRLAPQDPDDEPAEVLLERILAERRRKWEEQEWARLVERAQKKAAQAKRKAAGLPHYIRDLEPEEWQALPEEVYGKYLPKNDKWQEKYQEPESPDTSELPELPAGWVWTSVDHIAISVQYGTSDKASEENTGIAVLRMGNIEDGELDFENLKYMPKDWNGLMDFRLKAGDVLFNRTNSAELVGKTAVYKTWHSAAVFASYLIRVELANGYMSDLLAHYINSVYGRMYIASVVSQQVGQANVNGSKLKRMPVPLPPFKEQKRILVELDTRLSTLKVIKQIQLENCSRSERLRQSILLQAFSGRLAPQDPNDEPASALLARLRDDLKGKKT